jgi:hypothetical protein
MLIGIFFASDSLDRREGEKVPGKFAVVYFPLSEMGPRVNSIEIEVQQGRIHKIGQNMS